jgi:hypothetical protein
MGLHHIGHFWWQCIVVFRLIFKNMVWMTYHVLKKIAQLGNSPGCAIWFHRKDCVQWIKVVHRRTLI